MRINRTLLARDLTRPNQRLEAWSSSKSILQVMVKAREVILITGANRGIGLSLSQSLLKLGYRVAALDLSRDNLIPLQEATPNLLSLRCDITVREEIDTALEAILRKWQRVDVLVNNACQVSKPRPFEISSLQEIREDFEVNFFGHLQMIAALLPQFRKQGGGIVHNVSSGICWTGFPGILSYTSSKGALETMTRTLDLELRASGIRCNVIHPPLTFTSSSSLFGIPPEMMASPDSVGEKLARQILSVKPVITPDLRTGLFLFLITRFPFIFGRLFARFARKISRDSFA